MMAATTKREAGESGSIPTFVSRINQLDACELESELFSLLKSQILTCFKYVKSGLVSRLDPELNALLRLLIWKFTVEAAHATVGQQLLLLKYWDSDSKKPPTQRKVYFYAIALIGCQWMKERINDFGVIISHRPHLIWMHKVLDWGETALKCASLLNFLVFLRQGMYLSLVERALHLRTIPSVPNNLRQVTYEYMTRELLWHGFAEFLAFALPLINIHQVKQVVSRYFSPSVVGNTSSDNIGPHVCPTCQEIVCLPHEMGCGHVFCYYCIRQSLVTEAECICAVCGHRTGVENIVPVCYT